jgi:hypothetical protein
MDPIAHSNNDIIKEWVDPFLNDVNAARVAMDIKHNRKSPGRKVKARFRYMGGEIQVIGVIMSKGDIMTHKGKGANASYRKEKPFFNPIAEIAVEELANKLAINTGDVIGGHILIR